MPLSMPLRADDRPGHGHVVGEGVGLVPERGPEVTPVDQGLGQLLELIALDLEGPGLGVVGHAGDFDGIDVLVGLAEFEGQVGRRGPEVDPAVQADGEALVGLRVGRGFGQVPPEHADVVELVGDLQGRRLPGERRGVGRRGRLLRLRGRVDRDVQGLRDPVGRGHGHLDAGNPAVDHRLGPGRDRHRHHLPAQQVDPIAGRVDRPVAGHDVGGDHAEVVAGQEHQALVVQAHAGAPYQPRSSGARSVIPTLKSSKPPWVFS